MPMTWDDMSDQQKMEMARNTLPGKKQNNENISRAMEMLSSNPQFFQRILAASGMSPDQQEGTGQNAGRETSTTSPADLAGKIDRMDIDTGEPDGDVDDKPNPSPEYPRRGMQSEAAASAVGEQMDENFADMDSGNGPATDGQLEAADDAGYLNRREANRQSLGGLDGVPDRVILDIAKKRGLMR